MWGGFGLVVFVIGYNLASLWRLFQFYIELRNFSWLHFWNNCLKSENIFEKQAATVAESESSIIFELTLIKDASVIQSIWKTLQKQGKKI